jgi:hypothetical protein
LSLGSLTPALDDTNSLTVVKTKLLKDYIPSPATTIGGTCTAGVGDVTRGNLVLPTQPMTPKAAAGKLTGISSCAQGATAEAAATPPPPWPINGKITLTMSQVWPVGNVDAGKPVQIQTVVAFTDSFVDTATISGIVAKGAMIGAQAIANVWQDPATPAPTTPFGYQNSKWDIDLAAASGLGTECADGTAGNVTIPIANVLVGDGISPLSGLSTTGFTFQVGA